MKRLIFNSYFWLAFVMVSILFFILLPWYLLFCVGFLRHTLDKAIRWAICFYGWVLVKMVPFLAPVKVESRAGKTSLPAILVANHNSAIDPYLFGALLINTGFVTTWPFKIPIYGLCMRLAGYINANDGWEKVCQKSAKLLQSGASIIIWPEGRRSRDGRLGRFKNGAFALAVNTGYPLLPICIIGSEKFLPPGKRVFNPSRIKLVLLDPVFPDMQNDQNQEIIRLRNTTREIIEKTLAEEKKQFDPIPFANGFERGLKY